MPIQLRCPECRQKLSVASRKAGQNVTCPACGGSIHVPERVDDASAAGERPRESERQAERAGDVREALAAAQAASPAAAVAAAAAQPAIGFPAPDRDDDDAGGITLRRAGANQDEMDLTPMVDVTFLLLIFFMITAAFSMTKTIEVPPPDPEQQGAQQAQTLEDIEKSSIMVRIDSQNAILVEDEPVGDPARLVDVLHSRRRGEDKHELILQADAAALHETVVAVLDAANEVQFTRIRLAALRESNE